MKKILSLILTVSFLICNHLNAQNQSTNLKSEEVKLKSPSEFYPKSKTKVLVVGTFHFDYPNLDALKIEERDQIDVLSEQRQKEMQVLLDYLKKFKPTKIGIEAHNHRFTEDLRSYQAGKLKLGRDERHQLGVRLADELNLDTLYAIDAGSMTNDIGELIPDYMNQLWEDYDWKSDDLIDSLKRNWFNYQTNLMKEISLLNYLKYINTEESHQFGYGNYLTGDFRLGEFRGADVLSSYWYNRNLRIFRKIQDITESKEERILLIFGNGHAALLRQFLSCSPEYEFVEFSNL